MLNFQKRDKKYKKSLMQSAISSLDLFGQPPEFRILKQTKFSSGLGLMFTVTIATLCILYFAISMRDILFSTKPSITFSEIQSAESPPYELNINNFTMAIVLTNMQLQSFSATNNLFTITVQNCHIQRRLNSTTGMTSVAQQCNNYDTQVCEMDKHFKSPVQYEYFKALNLSNIYCLNYDQWIEKPPTVQGLATSQNYSYLTVRMSACKNTTTVTNCASTEVIDAKLASGYYSLHLSDALVKSEQSGYPFEPTISFQYSTFSKSTSKQIVNSLKNIVFKTDRGIIFEDIKEESSITLSNTREYQDSYNGQFIVYHTILMDSRQSIYSRQYQKVQTLLGNVGGLWQVLYLASSVLISPIVLMMTNLQMVNKIFDFDKQQQTGSAKEIRINSAKHISLRNISAKNLSSKNIVIGSNKDLQINLQDHKEISKYLRKRKAQLYYGFKEILLIVFGCKRQEQKQINYATDKIMSKLDVLFIVTQLMQVDKLKSVLLTNEQQKLFNYLPRPTIPKSLFEKDSAKMINGLEGIPQFRFILEEEKSDVMKLQDAYHAYNTIKKDQLSKVDSRLLDTLDLEILQLFESINQGDKEMKHNNAQFTSRQNSIILSPRSDELDEMSDQFAQEVPSLPGN